MVRVLHVLSELDSGGVEMMLYNYYKNMDKNQIKFDFIVHSDKEGMIEKKFLELKCKVYHVTPRRISIIENYKQIREIIFKKPAYDVLHGHQNFHSILPIYLAKKAGIRTRITHSHNYMYKESTYKKAVNSVLRKQILSLSTHLFACGEDAGKWLFGEKKVEGMGIKVMPNSIDLEKFKYDSDIRKEYRRMLGLTDKYVIGHVGRFVKQKNHEFLIDIFSIVKSKNKDAVLLLVGTGELESKIKEKVNSMKLSNSVIFLGVRQDISELMNAMDVFLLPSIFEGLGIVLIEAQATGLKCITSSKVVPIDAKVTSLLEYISLDEGAGAWADTTIKYSGGYDRRNMQDEIRRAGYDIDITSNSLEKFYNEVNE